MRISRLYQPNIYTVGETIVLDARASHYLKEVLRATIGTECALFNGEGESCAVVVSAITKKEVHVHVNQCVVESVESPLAIHLYQALCRSEKMDMVIQKAVELGVTAITPLVTERIAVSVKKEQYAKKIEHWRGVIISACEQCGRNRLPLLHEPQSLLDVALTIPGVVLSPAGTQTLASVSGKSLALFVGPEGGFSESEIRWCESQGMQCVRMGARVLRTETAALAAVSVLQAYLGDFTGENF